MVDESSELGIIEQQIVAWLKENVLYPDLKLHGKCDRVTLRHVSVDRKPQGDVKAFPIRLEEGAEDDGLFPLLHAISQAAQADSDEMNQGVQSYALFAYYPSDKNYVPRRYFRVSPSDVEIERGLSPSEPPTEKGLVAQMQRHVEAIMRTSTVANGHIFQTMQGEMRRLAEMNEKFSSQQIDFLVMMQDLLDNSHGRRLKERSEEAHLAMKEGALSKLEALLPVIINRIAGKPVVPEENRSLMLMASLLENMSEAQQMAFYQNLSDPQKIALAEVLSEYEQGKSKWLDREKRLSGLGAKNKLPPPNTTSVNAEVMSSDARPMPTAMSLRERMKLPTGQSEDPKIQQLEADAQKFAGKFRDLLNPKGETR